jgi:sec-independent protein translocase protein TatB
MFDIGWSELLVIGVVAIIVVGPKDLPKLMRGIGFYAGKLRRAATDFQRQFEEAMRESEMEEVRKSIESAKVEGRPFDQPVMLPKPQSEAKPQAGARPKPARKPGTAKSKPKREAKPKPASAKRRKKSEPAP